MSVPCLFQILFEIVVFQFQFQKETKNLASKKKMNKLERKNVTSVD